MGWKTLIIGCESKISLSENRLRISVDKDYHIYPLCDLDTIIFSHRQVVITIPLLVELMKNNVNIVICDEKNDPIGTFNSFNNHSLVFKQLKKQMNWRVVRIKSLWKKIIENKIKTEIDVLCLFEKSDKAIKQLKDFRKIIYTDDLTNREAVAARIYFNALFSEKFNRDEACPINFSLNYGYKIIASYISKCIVARGYLPQLGIHHKGESNPFNLTYDFIEPFRAIVDAWVYVHIEDKFTSSDKQALVGILDYKIFLNNKWFRLRDAIEDIVDSYIAFLNDESEDIISINLSHGIRDD